MLATVTTISMGGVVFVKTDGNGNQSTFRFKAVDALPWATKMDDLDMSNIPLIPLHLPNEYGYDPCDVTSFKPENMKKLLVDLEMKRNSTFDVTDVSSLPWMGYVNYDFLVNCGNGLPLHLYYAAYAALSAQVTATLTSTKTLLAALTSTLILTLNFNSLRFLLSKWVLRG